MHDLEFIHGIRGSRGTREVVARPAARTPHPTRAGGQDDGSYTNSLKRIVATCTAQEASCGLIVSVVLGTLGHMRWKGAQDGVRGEFLWWFPLTPQRPFGGQAASGSGTHRASQFFSRGSSLLASIWLSGVRRGVIFGSFLVPFGGFSNWEVPLWGSFFVNSLVLSSGPVHDLLLRCMCCKIVYV